MGSRSIRSAWSPNHDSRQALYWVRFRSQYQRRNTDHVLLRNKPTCPRRSAASDEEFRFNYCILHLAGRANGLAFGTDLLAAKRPYFSSAVRSSVD